MTKNKKLLLMFASLYLIINLLYLVSSVSEENETVVTKEIALKAINDSEKIIKEMQSSNFSVNYMNDALIEAERVFEQARYASILRGEVNATEKEKQSASDTLKLINWKNITYSSVLFYTEDISKRKETAFLLLDKLTVEESKINGVSNETKSIFDQAKLAFLEERYDDTEKLLLDFQNSFERERVQSSVLYGIKDGAKNFFQKYWVYIIVILIIISISGYFTYKKLERKILKNKIRKMKTEEQVLNSLMKKTQEERFKENNISGLVYNIRMKKYGEKLQEIKEELPVLEERLKGKKV